MYSTQTRAQLISFGWRIQTYTNAIARRASLRGAYHEVKALFSNVQVHVRVPIQLHAHCSEQAVAISSL